MVSKKTYFEHVVKVKSETLAEEEQKRKLKVLKNEFLELPSGRKNYISIDQIQHGKNAIRNYLRMIKYIFQLYAKLMILLNYL